MFAFSLSPSSPPPFFSLFDLVCGQEPKTKVRQILQSIVQLLPAILTERVCYSFCTFCTCAKGDYFLLLTDSCIIYTEDKTGWKELCTR